MTDNIKYEPLSAGFSKDEKAVELPSFEDEFEHMYYTDFPDPEEVEAYEKKYNGLALGPMLKWIDGRVASDKMVQYGEVVAELDKFSPKYCCDISFCRRVLLPELKAKLADLPASLIAVLYTLHLVHSEGTRLLNAEKHGENISFEAEFDSRIDGKIVTDACKYELHNFLSPAECDLTFDKPRKVK